MHLLSTLSKVEEDMAQDSCQFVAASSLITEVPVTVPTSQTIGGTASNLPVAEGSDLPLQSARRLPGSEEVVAGKGRGGSSGRDSTIGGSISSPVQSVERRQQSEETTELEEAETGGESIVQRTKFTALSKQP